MCVSTSVYITNENYEKLEMQRELSGISINKIVSKLLKTTTERKKIKPRLYRAVKYQKKEYECQEFRNLHIDLDEVLYERCLDMRKVFKLSVSLILAICITEYSEDLFRKETSTDNYMQNYVLFCLGDSEFSGYIVYWSTPPPDPPLKP